MVSKVKIKSSLLGKDRFVQHYLHEAGDRFDPEQHIRSLTLIKDELIADGYLLAQVTDSLNYDPQRKTVAVTLTLTPQDRYTVSTVELSVVGRAKDEGFEQEIRALIEGQLIGSYAQRSLLNEQGKKLRSFLVRKGFIKPKITLTQMRDDQKGQVEVVYTITLSKQKQVIFVGNTFFTYDQLLDDVLSLEEQGVTLPPSLLAQDIKQLYKKKGFTQATVDWQDDETRTIFSITEGPRHTIGTVTLKEEFTDADALSLIQQLEATLSLLGPYDEYEVARLLKQAAKDLANIGFWDVVLEKKVTSSKDEPKLTLEILITQSGNAPQRTSIIHVAIPGYEHLLLKEPFTRWQNLPEEKILRPSDRDEQRRFIIRYLRTKGYLVSAVSSSIEDTPEGRVLVWYIDDNGGPVTFGPVKIVGLHKMKPFIVERELCFHEGEVVSKQKMEESVKRLKGLSMFESIALHPQPIERVTQDGQETCVQPLLIKCCEDDPFEIRTRFGLQFVSKSFTNLSWTTWKLGGSFIWKNPTGYADRLILDADWTRYTLNLAASYDMPWIGPLPVRTLLKVYSDRYDQPLISNKDHRLYTEAHDGFSVTFNHVHPLWTTCVQTGFEFNKLSGISRELARAIQFEPKLVDKRTPYVYVEPSVTFEHFDDKIDPTKGFFTTLSLKAMIPSGIRDGWFVKALLEQSFFYPLYNNLIGAIRWRFGHIFNAKFSTILPTERFYLGGANSLRGYETNMVPPLNDFRCDGKCLWVPVGGKTMANINTELRFPLYKQLSGVLFTDMGILTQDKFADIAANKWLGATGFGLRFASPVGPIRFDIGWKWKKRDPRDKSYAFFFTFGHAF